jgi:TRAP-type C4-dicarboxylate transport system permease small subunit
MATAAAPGDSGWRGWPAAAAKFVLAAILCIAILDMLAGVVLRYVVVAISDYFDLPSVNYFWVEEVGEFSLAWLTLIGAAVAVLERTHFALAVLTHRFPPRLQLLVHRINHLLIAGFGVVAAIYGVKIAQLNATLVSPGLEINLAFLYAAAVIGGGLIAIFGLGVALGLLTPREVDIVTGPG